MPVTENTSLLFSSCHLAIAILVNKKQKIGCFPSLKKYTIFRNNKLYMTKVILPVIFKIVDSKQSGPYLFKFPIEKCIFFYSKPTNFCI